MEIGLILVLILTVGLSIYILSGLIKHRMVSHIDLFVSAWILGATAAAIVALLLIRG